MLAVLLLAASCAAPPALPLATERVTLGPQLQALRDPDRKLTLEQVTVAPACEQFVQLDDMANFGAVGGGVWLRLRPQIPPADLQRWRLVVRFAGLDKVCAHWPLRSGRVVSDCRLRDAPGWNGQRHVFGAPADYDARRTLYLYAESPVWLKLPAELITVDALVEAEAGSELFRGLYYGLLAAIVLVSLVSYAGGGDRAFLYFALHMGALVLALAMWQGQFAALDPPGWSLTRLAMMLVALFLALGARFFQSFLSTREHHPRAHRALEALFWLPIVLALVEPFAPLLATRVLGVVALLWLGAVMWASVTRARAGYGPAFAVLAALSVLLAAILLNALSVFGLHVFSAALTLQLVYVGALVASAFLVFGLLYRVRGLTDERNRAAELAQANQQLALRRARYDELTGLPNRPKFRDDVQERLLSALPQGKRLALLTVGLDKFRSINHALGHEGGDQVLIEIAMRMRQAMQPEDILARLGPDTFGWLTVIRGGQLGELKARCALLRKTLASPLLSGRGAILSCSMGASVFPQHATSADPLLRASDEAFYRAKDLGGGVLEIFDPELRKHAQLNLQLNKDLRQALIRDELELYYQPLVSMERNELLGVEALLRWQRNGVFVPPDQFIPIAESTELIVPLTDWVFRRACRQLVDWRRRQVSVPSMSVNISPHQFRLPDFAGRIEGVLKEYGLDGESIVLEITESALLDDMAATRDTLMRLRARGLRLAVDDFGVGYSSLSYLRTLPVQSVKIDRSFLQGVPSEPEAVSVINAIIALGRDLGLKVTAEGIETQEQHIFLAQRGTDVGQGYLIGRPMPAAQLEDWIVQQRPAIAAA